MYIRKGALPGNRDVVMSIIDTPADRLVAATARARPADSYKNITTSRIPGSNISYRRSV